MDGIPEETTVPSRQPITAAWTLASLSEVRRDMPMYAVVGVYAVFSWIFAIHLGDSQKYHPFQYVPIWTASSVALLTLIWAARAIWINPGRPFSVFASLMKRQWHQGFVQRLPLILVMGVFYGVFTSVKNMLPDIHPFTWDPALAAIDQRLLGDHDGWAMVAAIIPDGFPLRAMSIFYGWGWLVLVLGFSAYASVAPELRHLRRQFLLTLYLSWIVAGNILACLFMSGGPCFYAKLTGDHLRFAELLHSISGTESAATQDYLWTIYVHGWSYLGAGISAFPSVHIVSMALITLLLKSMGKWPFFLGVVVTILMELGSVRLGWHYAIDGIAAIIIAAVTWYIVQYVERLFAKSPAVTQYQP